MTRVVLAAHPFGLCLVVHLAGVPEAKDCCACRKKLCPACVAAKERR